MKNDAKLISRVLILLSIPFIMVAAAMWGGFVITVLWGWFIVPTFNVPQLSIPVAIGIAVIINFLTHQDLGNLQKRLDDRSNGMKFIGAITYCACRPAFALGIGWICQEWM